MLAVKASFGIAQLATWRINDEVERGGLVDVLAALATAGSPRQLIWPRSRQLTPKANALLEALTSDRRIHALAAREACPDGNRRLSRTTFQCIAKYVARS